MGYPRRMNPSSCAPIAKSAGVICVLGVLDGLFWASVGYALGSRASKCRSRPPFEPANTTGMREQTASSPDRHQRIKNLRIWSCNLLIRIEERD